MPANRLTERAVPFDGSSRGCCRRLFGRVTSADGAGGASRGAGRRRCRTSAPRGGRSPDSRSCPTRLTARLRAARPYLVVNPSTRGFTRLSRQRITSGLAACRGHAHARRGRRPPHDQGDPAPLHDHAHLGHVHKPASRGRPGRSGSRHRAGATCPNGPPGSAPCRTVRSRIAHARARKRRSASTERCRSRR